MSDPALRPPVAALVALGGPLEETNFPLIEKAAPLVDALPEDLTEAEVMALMTLFPASGCTAAGVNWSILHAIEHAECWPLWNLLEDPDHEWQKVFLIRLKNGGFEPPRASWLQKLLNR